MLGVIVNAGTILVGGSIGLLLKGGIKEEYHKRVMQVLGLCILVIGIQGAIKTDDFTALILCMIVGTLLGELLKLDLRVNALGEKVSARFRAKSDIAGGFVTTTLLFCIGSMAVVGSLNAGMYGDNSILFTKALLDGCSSVVFTAAMGAGVLLSAASTLVYQGLLVLASGYLAPVLSETTIAAMSAVGCTIIVAMALEMLGLVKSKPANMLPAMFLPIVYYLASGLF